MEHPSPNTHPAQSEAPVAKGSGLSNFLSRTSRAFTAEYSIFLIALGMVSSCLLWLVYLFFGLISDAMHGGSAFSYFPIQVWVLWLGVMALTALPIVAITWSRTQGELAHNEDMHGELPRGAAGFRTFSLVISGLSILIMTVSALFAPLAAGATSGSAVDALVSVTAPALVNVAITGLVMFMVTRPVQKRNLVRMLLWVLTGLVVVLFATDYIWTSTIKRQTSTPNTTPSTPYQYDEYNYPSSPYY